MLSYLFFEALLHFREITFELRDALLLPVHPFGTQFRALFFQRVALGGHLQSHLVQFIAAAMEIGDQIRGFMRFR